MTTLAFNFDINPVLFFLTAIGIVAGSFVGIGAVYLIIQGVRGAIAYTRGRVQTRKMFSEATAILENRRPSSTGDWCLGDWTWALRQVGTIESIEFARALESVNREH